MKNSTFPKELKRKKPVNKSADSNRRTSREKFPLPGSSFPQLMDLVRAYSTWGKNEVTVQQLYENLLKEIATWDISRNSKFLVKIGIVERVDQKGVVYRATSSGVILGKAFEDHDAIAVSKIWRKLIMKDSFFKKVLDTIRHLGEVDKSALKEFIVTESGSSLTGHKFSQHAVTIIEILKSAHLVVEHSRKTIKIRSDNPSDVFVNLKLINMIEESRSQFDCSRLIRYCEEINDNYEKGNYASVSFLARAIVDHIPPIFNQKNFSAVAAMAPGDRYVSFKKSCETLDNSLKNIVDRSIHKQINSIDIPPFKEEINFSQDLNTVLARVVEELQKT